MSVVKRIVTPVRATISRALLIGCAVSAVAVFALGCGGAGSGDGPLAAVATALPRVAGGAVARVGSGTIDQATYDRRFSAEAQGEEGSAGSIPLPPRFGACTTQLETAVKKLNLPVSSSSRLRASCQARYEALREKTLARLLIGHWVIGAASELGLRVGAAQVRQELDRSKRSRFSSEAQFQQYLAQTGLKPSDVTAEARVVLLAGLIRREILQPLGSLSRTQIGAYYKAHPELDSKPERRDIEIVRAGSLRAASRIKREIAAGKSFANAAKGLPKQPVGSSNGIVLNFERYAEPQLNHAMHTARPHVLTGPVFIGPGFPVGWYVFRVVRVHPLRQQPFREVEASLLKTLPGQLRRQALATFTSSWTARWKAKTSCARSYRISLCGQAGATSAHASLEVPGVFE